MQRDGCPFSSGIYFYLIGVDDEGNVTGIEADQFPNEPVYLKLGKEQRFYVRMGPSTHQLSVSEVVKRFRK